MTKEDARAVQDVFNQISEGMEIFARAVSLVFEENDIITPEEFNHVIDRAEADLKAKKEKRKNAKRAIRELLNIIRERDDDG